MAYHARLGFAAYKLKTARKEYTCLCCREPIMCSEKYYRGSGSTAVLCSPCYTEWDKKGGTVGNISRFKSIY